MRQAIGASASLRGCAIWIGGQSHEHRASSPLLPASVPASASDPDKVGDFWHLGPCASGKINRSTHSSSCQNKAGWVNFCCLELKVSWIGRRVRLLLALQSSWVSPPSDSRSNETCSILSASVPNQGLNSSRRRKVASQLKPQMLGMIVQRDPLRPPRLQSPPSC